MYMAQTLKRSSLSCDRQTMHVKNKPWSKIIINQLPAPLDNNNTTVHFMGIQESYLCIITCQKNCFQLFFTLLFQEKQDLQLILPCLVKETTEQKHSFQTHPFILTTIQLKQKTHWEKREGQQKKVKQIKIYHHVCQTQESRNTQQAN